MKRLKEDVGAPMSTLTNTPGMGNAQPASDAATTDVQQYSSSSIGSGDNWGNTYNPKKKKRVFKKKKKTNESFYPLIEDSINPYDKIGTAMAKKMKVKMNFKKGKGQTVKQANPK